eukprot:1057693-Amphidinium_carterae.1
MTFSGGMRTQRDLIPVTMEPISVELRREILKYALADIGENDVTVDDIALGPSLGCQCWDLVLTLGLNSLACGVHGPWPHNASKKSGSNRRGVEEMQMRHMYVCTEFASRRLRVDHAEVEAAL